MCAVFVAPLSGCGDTGDSSASPAPEATAAPAFTPPRTEDESEILFDPKTVRRYDLELPAESWDLVAAEAVPPGCLNYARHYYSGALSLDGQSFAGVGLRAKGGCGSARDLTKKTAFKVNLAWDDPSLPGCPEKRRLHGESHFTFNNAVQDPTLAHEMLGYGFFRALGLPAPRTAHVRLYVNGDYWGVYVLVETIDRRFLRRWFGSHRGMMYEGAYGCDLLPENVPASDDERSCLSQEFTPSDCSPPEPGDDPLGWELARDLAVRLEALGPGGFYPEVGSFFDIDGFLLQWAADSVISHWDSYEDDVRSNYRVYHDPSTGLWSLIETGIDMSFVKEHDPWDVAGVLAKRCLTEPECEAAFNERLRQALEVFEAMDLAAEARRIHDRIRRHVEEDPRKPMDILTFDGKHLALQAWLRTRAATVRRMLEEREGR